MHLIFPIPWSKHWDPPYYLDTTHLPGSAVIIPTDLPTARNSHAPLYSSSHSLPCLRNATGPGKRQAQKPDQSCPDPAPLSRNRESHSPILGQLNWTNPSQASYSVSQVHAGNPTLLTGCTKSGRPRSNRPRAARLATGILTCGPRRQKHTRDPHLPVMRVTMATTLHSGVYPPPDASRWFNRACRAPLLPVRKVGSSITYTIYVIYK